MSPGHTHYIGEIVLILARDLTPSETRIAIRLGNAGTPANQAARMIDHAASVAR